VGTDGDFEVVNHQKIDERDDSKVKLSIRCRLHTWKSAESFCAYWNARSSRWRGGNIFQSNQQEEFGFIHRVSSLENSPRSSSPTACTLYTPKYPFPSRQTKRKEKKNLHVGIMCVCVLLSVIDLRQHFLLVLFFFAPEVIKVAYPFELEMKLENALCDTKNVSVSPSRELW